MVSDFRDPEDKLQRAMSRFERGKLEDARGELKALLEIGYRSVEVYLYLGHCDLEAGDLGRALSWYRQAGQCNPGHPDVYLGRGVVAARSLRFGRATRLFRRAPRGVFAS